MDKIFLSSCAPNQGNKMILLLKFFFCTFLFMLGLSFIAIYESPFTDKLKLSFMLTVW